MFSRDFLVIKGLGVVGKVKVTYAGRIHVRGEQGRAEIRYDQDTGRWFIRVFFEVSEKIVKGEWAKVSLKPLGVGSQELI